MSKSLFRPDRSDSHRNRFHTIRNVKLKVLRPLDPPLIACEAREGVIEENIRATMKR